MPSSKRQSLHELKLSWHVRKSTSERQRHEANNLTTFGMCVEVSENNGPCPPPALACAAFEIRCGERPFGSDPGEHGLCLSSVHGRKPAQRRIPNLSTLCPRHPPAKQRMEIER